jgi:hypothetical protein
VDCTYHCGNKKGQSPGLRSAACLTHRAPNHTMGAARRPELTDEISVSCLQPRTSGTCRVAKGPEPRISAPAIATTLRRGLKTTEYLYVKLPCPSVHTSYSKIQFQHYICTPMS